MHPVYQHHCWLAAVLYWWYSDSGCNFSCPTRFLWVALACIILPRMKTFHSSLQVQKNYSVILGAKSNSIFKFWELSFLWITFIKVLQNSVGNVKVWIVILKTRMTWMCTVINAFSTHFSFVPVQSHAALWRKYLLRNYCSGSLADIVMTENSHFLVCQMFTF